MDKTLHGGPKNGDFNGDGFVDATDASIMAANWGNHNKSEDGNVPEPGIVILLLTGLAAVGLPRGLTKSRFPTCPHKRGHGNRKVI